MIRTRGGSTIPPARGRCVPGGQVGGDIEQVRYYHPGIGTQEVFSLERIWAGMTGSGLARNVKSAYAWLSANYDPGDEIFLLGFSRGAFTARALSGLIASQGVPVTQRNREGGFKVNRGSLRVTVRRVK